MQWKFTQILVTSLFLLITSVFVDEGRTLMFIGDNIHLQDSDHHNDLELPHQHKHSVSVDDAKIVNHNYFDLSWYVNTGVHVSYNYILKPLDYSVAIWQPPKFF